MKISLNWEKRIGPILYLEINGRTFGFCFCHRKPERTFNVIGLNLLCSRCMGILFGVIIGLFLKYQGFSLPIIWALIFILPLIFDGFYQAFYQQGSDNYIRFFTGFFSGIGIVFLGIYLGDV